MVRSSAAAARDIADQVRHQSVGIEQVAAAMRQLSEATQLDVDASREMEGASASLAERSRGLKALVGRYRV